MLRSKVKKALGILPQEYVCVALEDVQDHPSVFMTVRGSTAVMDVTDRHVVLGYRPLVIAVGLDDNEKVTLNAEGICMTFAPRGSAFDNQWRGYPSSSNGVARVELKSLSDDAFAPGMILFTGTYGEHSFLPFHQLLANRLVDSLRRKPSSDANLEGNLYEQVRIAYCIPRIISVITVKDEDLLNFFPTDLHGSAGGEYYLSSLRIGGMACSQVESQKRIVISRVSVAAFKKTYGLGKNHMKSLQPSAQFELGNLTSASGIPVYPNAISFIELERIGQRDVGIHRIFLYKIIERRDASDGKTLAHIHRYYAQWRINHQLSAEYFYR